MIRPLVIMLALAGCAPMTTPEAAAPPTSARETITYSTGPCFGSCPVYSVAVSSDGQATFTGNRFTAVSGARNFTVSPAQYRAFASLLTPHLPASGVTRYAHGEPNCPNAPTDMPSAQVRRTTGTGESGIDFYYGCSRDNPKVAEALRAAPDKLPIAAFIGDRAAFAGQR